MSNYLSNVVTLKVYPDKCIGCNTCVIVCPHQILGLVNKKVHIIEKDNCIECGACKSNCPREAIDVEVGVGCASAIINSPLL
jgi:ferredoxin